MPRSSGWPDVIIVAMKESLSKLILDEWDSNGERFGSQTLPQFKFKWRSCPMIANGRQMSCQIHNHSAITTLAVATRTELACQDLIETWRLALDHPDSIEWDPLRWSNLKLGHSGRLTETYRSVIATMIHAVASDLETSHTIAAELLWKVKELRDNGPEWALAGMARGFLPSEWSVASIYDIDSAQHYKLHSLSKMVVLRPLSRDEKDHIVTLIGESMLGYHPLKKRKAEDVAQMSPEQVRENNLWFAGGERDFNPSQAYWVSEGAVNRVDLANQLQDLLPEEPPSIIAQATEVYSYVESLVEAPSLGYEEKRRFLKAALQCMRHGFEQRFLPLDFWNGGSIEEVENLAGTQPRDRVKILGLHQDTRHHMGVDRGQDAEFTRAISEYLIPLHIMQNDAAISGKAAAITARDDHIEVAMNDLQTNVSK